MNFDNELFLRGSHFSKYLVGVNALDSKGFKEWVYYPGMLFNAPKKWWGVRGKRGSAHEGLDICFYRNAKNEILRLDETANIPAAFDGMVVKIINDFLGKSVIIEHLFQDNIRLCSIYAHIVPLSVIQPGTKVRGSDIIGTLSSGRETKSGVSPHLHLSLGVTPEHISYENLEWKTIRQSESLKLIDPLPLFYRDHIVLAQQ